MTKPAPGNYVIVSRVLSCNGQKLAITFCKKGGAVTLTPLTHRQEQIWTISDYSDGQTQYVVPKKDDDLQIAIGGKVAVTLPAGEYVWTIRRGQDGVWYVFSAVISVHFCSDLILIRSIDFLVLQLVTGS
ncbi:hypothetical protein TWF106_003515 [Orbilia oligospora]|uniref:CCL2-like lectin domain-containing protein n=1 Tax=Orbilia oligospora TaxID=2813651 RepID=A0A7C8Q8P0_ORBOL|nr:hypothetical protein TWF106_003515 [Orbilia oligospora]